MDREAWLNVVGMAGDFDLGGEDKRAKSSDHVWHQMGCSLGQNKQLLLNTFVHIFEKSIDHSSKTKFGFCTIAKSFSECVK